MSYVAKQPTLFEVFGRTETPSVPEINESSLNALVTILLSGDTDEGKVVLLHSPRAGYGKTLLLHAARDQVGEAAKFFAVEPSGGGRLDGEVVLESLLRQLATVLPGSGGLTEFDFLTRRLLAVGLKPLLISGEIPSHDREGALYAIEQRPIETFDFHHQQAATAHWTQANFEVLGPRLASELSEFSKCGLRDCAYWVDLLFRYATTPPEKVERTQFLSDAVFAELQGQGASLAEERLQSLLGLIGLLQPVILVFDETEGLSNQPEAGLRVAAFMAQLRQTCPGLTIILSVNEDVWETGLTPLMPGGLRDRLTEYVVKLGEMSRTEAEVLLESRFGDAAGLISSRLSWPEPLYARALLKESAGIARELSAAGYFAEAVPVVSEAPVERGSSATPPPLEQPFAAEAAESVVVSDEESASTPFAAATVVGAVSTAAGAEAAEAAPSVPSEGELDVAVEAAPSVEAPSPFEIVADPVPEVPTPAAAPTQVAADARDFAVEAPTQATPVATEPSPFSKPVEEVAVVAEQPAAASSLADGGIFQDSAPPATADVPREPEVSAANPFTIAVPSESSVPQPASQPILPERSPFEVAPSVAAAPAQPQAASDFSAPAESSSDFSASAPSEPVSVDHARDWVARQTTTEAAAAEAPAPAVAASSATPQPAPFDAPASPPALPPQPEPTQPEPTQPEPVASSSPPASSFAAPAAPSQGASQEGDSSEVEELLNQFKQRFGQGGKS